jgi:hypothetical protein
MKTIVVEKQLTNEEVKKLEGIRLPKGFFKILIQEDTDLYNTDGMLLARFRKNVLSGVKIDLAYENLIHFAKKKTTTRGNASGNPDKPKITGKNDKIMSNIMGYFDTTAVSQKSILKKAGMPIPKCRETSFTGKFPDKWKNVIPLIDEIDAQYKLLCPQQHAKQYEQTKKTKFQIENTAFTTITTNVNLQTGIHTDKGDYKEGFGNLIVIERGTYSGGYTGFPQYGVAIDVRQGDFLAMDVHQFHGNEPIESDGEFERLSIVSYMREGIVRKCVGEDIVGEEYFRKASKIVNELKKLVF